MSGPEANLEIRPITPGDKAALAAAVDQSSDDAVYSRFLKPHGRLTAAELRYLTEVDHHDHEALLAVDPDSDHSVGIARYVRDHDRRDSAEIAVAVLEPWQGRGVGKVLLHGWPIGPGTRATPSSRRSRCPRTGPCDGCSRIWAPPGSSAPARERSSSP
jgi:GNAT superfamily N-acetyltransferase